MAVREIEVASLGELIDRVTPEEPDPAVGRLRDCGVYRGSGHVEWPLLTSLDRLGGVDPPHTKAGLEEHILRNFIRYSRPYFPTPPVNEWELLVAAQHHGLPTRLLDWTYSPLVAAHFATLSRRPVDRVVWRLDWKPVHRRFAFPELALLIQDLDRLIGGDGGFAPWDLMAANGNEHGRNGDRGQERHRFACLIEPPSLDARIVAQSAAFTLCSDATQPFDRFLAEHGLEDTLTKFILPASRVDRFRDQLDLVSVDERRLFPDLDGVTAQMHRYYS
jgi:hypothetical protein